MQSFQSGKEQAKEMTGIEELDEVIGLEKKKMVRLDIVILRMASWASTSNCRSVFERVNSLKRPSEVKTSMASVQVESNILNTE